MSINEKSYAYGAQKSSIREIAAYGAARKAQIGAENVFDFSLGNPSIPAPEVVRASIARSLELPATELHGYTAAAGMPAAREAVAAAINERTKAVIINSPNNPVGSVYAEQNLRDLAAALTAAEERLGTQIYLVADEPYREITYGADVPWVPDIYDRTIVCYSYSKSLSLPGERIGWILVPGTNPDHDRLVLAVAGAGRKLGFVCAPALFQRVVVDCIDEPSDVEAYAENRRALTEGLSELGYEYIEPEGAFYLWVKALEPDANAFFERAKALELLPVPSDSFGCPGWVRVGYCVSHDTIVNSMPSWKKLAESYK